MVFKLGAAALIRSVRDEIRIEMASQPSGIQNPTAVDAALLDKLINTCSAYVNGRNKNWNIAKWASEARSAVSRARGMRHRMKSLRSSHGICAINCQPHDQTLSLCNVCQKWICEGCRRPGFLQCQPCHKRTNCDVYFIEPFVSMNAPPTQCYLCFTSAERCTLVDGRCQFCNRWLCTGCALECRPVTCAACPFKNRMAKPLHEAGA